MMTREIKEKIANSPVLMEKWEGVEQAAKKFYNESNTFWLMSPLKRNGTQLPTVSGFQQAWREFSNAWKNSGQNCLFLVVLGRYVPERLANEIGKEV